MRGGTLGLCGCILCLILQRRCRFIGLLVCLRVGKVLREPFHQKRKESFDETNNGVYGVLKVYDLSSLSNIYFWAGFIAFDILIMCILAR